MVEMRDRKLPMMLLRHPHQQMQQHHRIHPPRHGHQNGFPPNEMASSDEGLLNMPGQFQRVIHTSILSYLFKSATFNPKAPARQFPRLLARHPDLAIPHEVLKSGDILGSV